MWDFMAEEGIWYPSAGIDAVPRLLGERLRQIGGQLHLGARVAGLLVEGGRVRGVLLADGAEVRAEWVVCGADYRRMVVRLLPAGSIAPAVRRGILDLPLTRSAFTLFLGVEAGRVDLSVFRGQQLLVRPEEGVPTPWVGKANDRSAFLRDEIWLSHWSAHDPGLAPPGMEALVIKVTAPFDAFAAFSDREGDRLPAYHEVKRRLVDHLLVASDRVLPGLAGAVRVLEAATPLTYRDRGHRSEGAVAGWSWQAGALPEPYARSLVVTPLHGLLAVGILAFTRLFQGGLGTSLASGRWAAEVVLGRRDAVPDMDWLAGWRR
jgi:phytoene dehydrogenase-like protein